MIFFLLLVITPILVVGAMIAIFMYCSHYLLSYARDSVTQLFEEPEVPQKKSKKK